MAKVQRRPRRTPNSGIKKDAGADELVKAGTALGSLMENEVVNIVVTEKAEVAEAE